MTKDAKWVEIEKGVYVNESDRPSGYSAEDKQGFSTKDKGDSKRKDE